MEKKDSLKFTPQKSVEWYNPVQLARTGVKVLISTVLGNFNDKREIQAALYNEEPKKHFDDFKDRNELWVDYIADLGDGFNATYTMAKLLSLPELKFEGQTIPRGNILVMGGDQVYPTASREEYNNRLKGPYEMAFPCIEKDKDPPQLFAIPGNHDWYDGLTNFLKIFGQGRNIGNWQTKQHRSYFALRLPHNVWLFGIDVQLNSDIDWNQLEYFKTILENKIIEGSKIILCTAEPSWLNSTSKDTGSYNNLKFFEELISGFINETTKIKKVSQVLTLAGDLHHYARYKANDGSQKITAGGGGAFMHPTHHLPKEISELREGKMVLEKTFPSSKQSQKLLLRNFWFPLNNWRFAMLLGGVYSLLGWMLFLHFENGSIDLPLQQIFLGIIYSPTTCVLLIIFILGLHSFAETKPLNARFKNSFVYSLFGWWHALSQAFLVILFFRIVIKLNPLLTSEIPLVPLLSSGCAFFAVGFLIGGFVFGLYLIFANLFLGNHDNEAYSSLKLTGYKNFIRLHITKEKITIYPIGIKNIQKWKYVIKNNKGNFETKTKIECQFIEDPIIINFSS